MPISYDLDRAASVIRTRCYGPVTLDEVLEHFRTLRAEMNLPRRLDVFLDWSEITSSPTADQIRGASEGLNVLKGAVKFGYCAITANRDALYGLARMWAVLAEPFFTAIGVFRSLREASAWFQMARRSE